VAVAIIDDRRKKLAEELHADAFLARRAVNKEIQYLRSL